MVICREGEMCSYEVLLYVGQRVSKAVVSSQQMSVEEGFMQIRQRQPPLVDDIRGRQGKAPNSQGSEHAEARVG